jgi:hypothetical protein
MTRFFRASGMLAVGFALGILAAGAGMAAAAMGKKGWERFGPMFKQGYAAGFNDAVRIAKTSDPESFLARQFRLPPEAKALDWVVMIDRLYAEKENEKRPLPQIFMIAGPKLEAKFGTEADAQRKAFEKMAAEQAKVRAAQRAAAGAAAVAPDSGPDAEPGHAAPAAPANSSEASPAAPKAAPAEKPAPAETPAESK